MILSTGSEVLNFVHVPPHLSFTKWLMNMFILIFCNPSFRLCNPSFKLCNPSFKHCLQNLVQAVIDIVIILITDRKTQEEEEKEGKR